MKLINPIGRDLIKLETGASFNEVIPFGCICSSGQASLAEAYNCASCACQCDHGEINRDANFDIADTQRNYVNT